MSFDNTDPELDIEREMNNMSDYATAKEIELGIRLIESVAKERITSLESQLASAKAEIEKMSQAQLGYYEEIKHLREALANIGNEAGSPIMGYAPEIAKRELENSRLKISVMAQAALDGGKS